MLVYQRVDTSNLFFPVRRVWGSGDLRQMRAEMHDTIEVGGVHSNPFKQIRLYPLVI